MAIREVLKFQDVKAASRLRTSFRFADLEVQLGSPDQLQQKPNIDQLEFGKIFTDHMFKVQYEKQWQKPRISLMENIVLHPAAKVLHYAVELFEGMKAYRGVDTKIRLFRPDLNMIRMNNSAVRSGLPTFDSKELIKIICRLIQIDQEWVPHAESASLYIRPTIIGTDPLLGVTACKSALLFVICSPVGSYFKGSNASVSLLADPQYTRAWPGGCGDKKMGCNYSPTILVHSEAIAKGMQQVLWLFGDDHQITEAGTMNVFVVIRNENGEKELITPPLNGLILPGVTRASILQLCKEHKRSKVSERTINMNEFVQLVKQGRVLEMFGAGTACVVTPVSSVLYKEKLYNLPTMEQEDKEFQFYEKTLLDIQYGYINHPWGFCIDDYCKNET